MRLDLISIEAFLQIFIFESLLRFIGELYYHN